MSRRSPSIRRLAFGLALCSLPLWGQTTPTIAPTLPNAVLGDYYFQTLAASGGYGPGTYSFFFDVESGGTLPPGVQLSAAGTLSGTLTQAGTYNFTVQVSSFNNLGTGGVFGSQSFTVTIYPTLAITNPSLPPGIVGAAYSQTLTAFGGAGAGTYSFSIVPEEEGGNLPPGITLSANGTLSGTPTAIEGTWLAFGFTVQVASTDAGGDVFIGMQDYVIWIYATPQTIAPTSLPNGVAGDSYPSQTLTSSGGNDGNLGYFYTFSLYSGTLPPGITLTSNPASPGTGGTATLSGTPTTAGTYNFTVQVASAGDGIPTLTGTQAYTVVIYPSLTISALNPSPGTVGTPYSQPLAASGGAGPASYTWSLVESSPPPGLTLSAAGVLSGTPTASGSFPVYVMVSSQVPNFGAVAAYGQYSVLIAPPPFVIAGSLGGGMVGVPYSATLVATGGAPPFVWSVSSGSSIPNGLSFNASTATLSGTPTTPGTFSLTIAVNDATGRQAIAFFIVNIVPPLVITTQTPAAGVQGTAYTQAFAATGGAPPYQWSIDTPPPGLTMSSSSGALSGTPSASGTFNFNVKVTDSAALSAPRAFPVVISPILTIAPVTPSGGFKGLAYSQSFAATGGAPPYQWSIDTPPPGLAMNPSSGVLSGTPSAAGTFNLNVKVTDSAALSATRAFTIAIANALTIVTPSLPGGTVGTAYSQQLSATGGSPPYKWTVAGGALPAGITLDGPSGALSGSPTAAGSFPVTIGVSDATPQTVTAPFTIAVGLPSAPVLTFSGLPATLTPNTQPVLGLSIGGVYPVTIQGTVTLTFAPASGPDDPNVQFTTGGRTVAFQFPAGFTQAQFPSNFAVQTGTVAGAITLTLTLRAGGIDMTPSPAPTEVLRVAASPPVITSTTIAASSGGFNLVIVGYATTRDMSSATVTFTPASGVTLSTNNVNVPLSQVFTTWYASATSAQFGSMFSLTIPFTTQGGANALASVSVVLTNSQGNSAPGAATF